MSKLYDLLQSVINKVKNTEKSLESMPKTVNGVEPDENGNVAVSSSWNDIAYKPFRRSSVTVLENTLIHGFEISDDVHEHVSGDVFVCHNPNIELNLLSEMPIIEAQWDGTIYEVTYENQVIGNEYLVNPDAKDNGLPFLIVNSRHGVNIYTTDSGTEHAISMYVDGVMIEDSPFMKVKNHFEFWISYDEENNVYSADKTYYDILHAYESGKTITVYLNGIPYTTPVITKLEDGTIFLGNFDFTIAIYPDDYVEYYENAFVTYDEVSGMIDDTLKPTGDTLDVMFYLDIAGSEGFCTATYQRIINHHNAGNTINAFFWYDKQCYPVDLSFEYCDRYNKVEFEHPNGSGDMIELYSDNSISLSESVPV